MALIKFSTPPTLAGFFFCLASTRCRAFLFAQRRVSHIQAFTAQSVSFMQLYRQNAKTVYRALQRLFRLFALFQRTQYSSRASRLYTACATLEGIPSSVAPPQIPNTTATPDAVQLSTAAYYNNVYIRVQGCAPVVDPCQTVQHIADHASPAACNLAPVSSHGTPGQPSTLHPAGQSSSRSAVDGAEPLAATAASLFGLSPDNQ